MKAQTVSFETAKALEEAGFQRETVAYWHRPKDWEVAYTDDPDTLYNPHPSAFSLEELLDELPYGFILEKRHTGEYMVSEDPRREASIYPDYPDMAVCKDYNPCEAVAEMLLKLREAGYL